MSEGEGCGCLVLIGIGLVIVGMMWGPIGVIIALLILLVIG